MIIIEIDSNIFEKCKSFQLKWFCIPNETVAQAAIKAGSNK